MLVTVCINLHEQCVGVRYDIAMLGRFASWERSIVEGVGADWIMCMSLSSGEHG